ncbi:MAG: hypothetical protein QOH92_567 [Chloroflexota bacterium]|jgi:hypothetical protein|nr:hypothetical protein [Chloroflexota bacterium]
MNLLASFADPAAACKAVAVLYGISVAISFAEKWSTVADYGPQGWFPWRIFQFDRAHLFPFRQYPRPFAALFGTMGMSATLASGVASVALMLVSPPRSWAFTVALGLIVTTCMALNSRSIYGGDGSQQMNLLIGVALLLGFNPFVGRLAGEAGLIFIAAQSCLAYLVSGVAKLVSPVWMRGDPLLGILSTKAYGSPFSVQMLLMAPRLRRVGGLAMVCFETCFPLCLALPLPALAIILVWGLLFHMSNAVIMGLNTFVWAFVATYPAICFAWYLLH